MLSLEIANALAMLGASDEKYTRGAVAGCGCPGGPVLASPFDLLPEPVPARDGTLSMPPGWQPPAALLTDRQLMRLALSRGCVSEIYSPIITIAAGDTETVRVEPEQGCFLALTRRIIARDAATEQDVTNVRLGQEFVGVCPIGCSTVPHWSAFVDTDDCEWCPMPQLDLGRGVDGQQYNVAVTNPTADPIMVQAAIRGVCYPRRGCFSGFAASSCSVCN